jgi:hypothetical protein
LPVDKQEVFKLPHIHIYIAGDKFTLEPSDYLVCWLSLDIISVHHYIRTLFTSCAKSSTMKY